MMVAVAQGRAKRRRGGSRGMRRSITELCTLDHHGDADTLANGSRTRLRGLSLVAGARKIISASSRKQTIE